MIRESHGADLMMCLCGLVGCGSTKPRGFANGANAAMRDDNNSALRVYFKTKYPVHDAKMRTAVEEKLGIQIMYAIVGDSELEDDEAFIDGYNDYAIRRLDEEHGVETVNQLLSMNWQSVLTGEQSRAVQEP